MTSKHKTRRENNRLFSLSLSLSRGFCTGIRESVNWVVIYVHLFVSLGVKKKNSLKSPPPGTHSIRGASFLSPPICILSSSSSSYSCFLCLSLYCFTLFAAPPLIFCLSLLALSLSLSLSLPLIQITNATHQIKSSPLPNLSCPPPPKGPVYFPSERLCHGRSSSIPF